MTLSGMRIASLLAALGSGMSPVHALEAGASAPGAIRRSHRAERPALESEPHADASSIEVAPMRAVQGSRR